MRIDTSNNFQISINTGNNISTQNTNDTSKSGNVKSIYVGNLNQNNTTQNNIEQKKQQARKQAMKLMSDAWDKDKSRQGKVDDLNNTKSDTVQQISDLKERIKDIDNEKENKRLEYGVDKDSQEQKDLELLEKYQENRYGSANDKFSQEEVDRLKELQNTPLTDYQKSALRLNSTKTDFNTDIDRLNSKLMGLSMSIIDAETDREKAQDMVKASDTGDKIIEAANDEILGMLVAEGKDNLDQKTEEAERKQEEAQDQQQEQDERLDDIKEKRKEQEKIIKSQANADNIQIDVNLKKQTTDNIKDAQDKIQKLMKENNMTNEDIKGIEIDLNF